MYRLDIRFLEIPLKYVHMQIRVSQEGLGWKGP